jgi:hypothetical protein
MRLFVLAIFLFLSQSTFAFAPIPQIGDLKTLKFVGEKEAFEQIYKLHGKKFPLKNAYVAEYASKTHYAIIWASQSENSSDAFALFETMNKKMPKSNAFKNMKSMKINNIAVVYVFGMGMDNYYFLIEDKNYWIAIKGKNTVDIVKDFLKKEKSLISQ